MRRIMAERAHFEITVQNYSGGLWALWVFHTQTLRSRDKLPEECWICHSFLFLLGEMGPVLWVKRHLSWLHILFWEWNSEGIEAQYKFHFHCSPKLCLSCICQGGVWNSSKYKESYFPPEVRQRYDLWLLWIPCLTIPRVMGFNNLGWNNRSVPGRIHPSPLMHDASPQEQKDLFLHTWCVFIPIRPHWGELSLSFCWGNKKKKKREKSFYKENTDATDSCFAWKEVQTFYIYFCRRK